MSDDPTTAFTNPEYHKVAPVPDTGRPSIYECRQPELDWIAHLLDTVIPLPRTGSVLDAGCGPGAYVPAVAGRLSSHARFTALDINHSRVRMVDPSLATRATADITSMPFRDGSFDVVLAMHMLYHVPHVPDAVRELHRVLRPGGVLYALTNSEHAQWELTALYLRNGGDDEKAFGDTQFSNESGGALLRTVFPDHDVELIEMRDSQLVVTDPECLIDELQRLRYTLEPGLRPDSTWDDLIALAREDASRIVQRDGAFRISENHGLFTCRKR
jgi:SAM-dependent methyltransferase